MLLNLAVNARDAMPDGGLLTIETRDVEAAFGTAPRVALVVSDTGTGMDEDVREHVFEPFFTTKPTGQGTGLGLATVHGIVTQSGGSIEVASTPGVGTTFTVLLPRVARDADADESATRRTPDGDVGVAVRETILLVEDDADVRALTRQLLEGCGYRVLTASDGHAAVAVWEQWGAAVDLVLTDVMMPGMSGLDLRRQLLAERPDVLVLCMSGYSERLARGAEDGEVAFIAKPFTAVGLAGRVRTLLDARTPRAATRPAARA
jgi:two-component system, cell cycle sensor histidine kinase and response regulator CckA